MPNQAAPRTREQSRPRHDALGVRTTHARPHTTTAGILHDRLLGENTPLPHIDVGVLLQARWMEARLPFASKSAGLSATWAWGAQVRAFGEKEADGRPQVFLSCSSLLTRLRGVMCDGDTDNGVLTAHKRGGCGGARSAWRERVLGPLWLPPPFFLHEESSFRFSSESDDVSFIP